MKSLVKSLSLALGITIASVGAPAMAQSAVDLNELLERVKQNKINENAENQQRIAQFTRERNRQSALLRQAEQDVKTEEAISVRLEKVFADNELLLAQLDAQLSERLGVFQELVGVVKQVAGDIRGQMGTSLISAEHPTRGAAASVVAEKKDLPSVEDLHTIWHLLHDEATRQGEVSRFNATIKRKSGNSEEAEVVRMGPFVAVTKYGFVTYTRDDDTKKSTLTELAKQPGGRHPGAGQDLFKSSEGSLVESSFDPSRGGLMSLEVLKPSLKERWQAGQQVGYIITGLFVLGVLYGLMRIFSLMGTNGAVKRQVRNKKISKSNPLGRVMAAYEDNAGANVETLELKLDEAILREVPKLESGLNMLKVLAAVAPMLGLLGTVTGMILTFQAIQLYGAGDPKMMAGGISQALITTVLGLITAIPILLIHSFASGFSKSVVNILEEQATGMVAARSEGR